MGLIVTILKSIDAVLAGAQLVDKGITKVKAWKRKRRLVKKVNQR